MKNPFHGTGVALVTPFNEDHSIDFDALRRLVQYQLDNGTNFLVVQGTTGESPVLTKDEKLRVLETVQEVNNGKLPIVFGVGGNNTEEIGKTLQGLPGGIDGILSVSPYYNKPTQNGIVAHYKHLASCTDSPIILYNVPGRTGSNVLADTTLELAEVDNIVAMKEASGDFTQIMKIIQYKPDGFGLLSGDDAITLPMIAAGADGVISVVANALPDKFSSMVNASLKGEFETARKFHYELLEITNMFFAEGNPGGVKESLAHQGIMRNTMRLPLYSVSDGLRNRIIKETDRILGA